MDNDKKKIYIDIEWLIKTHKTRWNQRQNEKNPNLSVDFHLFLRIIRDERKVEANADSI